MNNLDFAQIVAPIDVRVCGNDHIVLKLILNAVSGYPEATAGEVIERGDITLDKLCQGTWMPKPHVFAAVARLEEFGLIPESRIR